MSFWCLHFTKSENDFIVLLYRGPSRLICKCSCTLKHKINSDRWPKMVYLPFPMVDFKCISVFPFPTLLERRDGFQPPGRPSRLKPGCIKNGDVHITKFLFDFHFTIFIVERKTGKVKLFKKGFWEEVE